MRSIYKRAACWHRELAESAVKLKAVCVFVSVFIPFWDLERSVNVIHINLKDKQNGKFAPARPAA